MVTGSRPVLETVTLKVKLPPGAGSDVGVASLTTLMTGGRSRMVTVASSESVAVVPSASVTTTVTTSVWDAPAAPVKSPGKVQGTDEAPGASVVPMSAPQVEPGRVARLP